MFKKVFSDKNENAGNHDDFNEVVKRESVKFKPKLDSGNILFVCHNCVVSPIAESIFNRKISNKRAYFAGFSVTSGISIHPRTIEVCLNHGMDLSGKEVMDIDDYELNDGVLILTSNVHYRELLKEKHPNLEIFTINEYAGFSNLDINDYLGYDSDWEESYVEIKNAVDKIAEIFSSEEPVTDNVIIDTNKRNFKYLDYLIHSGVDEVVLDSDIVLDDDEIQDYLDGIPLDVDNLVLDAKGHSIDAMGKVRIFNVTGCNVLLKDIIFSNGFSSNSVMGGGAILNGSKNISCNGCKFIYDSSLGSGGAIYNGEHSSLSLDGCQFLQNNSNQYGGAIYNDEDAVLSVGECQFSNNVSEFDGGAIYTKARLTVKNAKFMENTVKNGNGGAIFNSQKVDIERSIFKNNAAFNDYYYNNGGGAIYNHSGKLSVINSKFKSNHSSQNGGALLNNNDANAFVDDVMFCLNDSQKEGKCIFNKGELEIRNSKFHTNSSIFNGYGNLKIHDSTFTDNGADYIIMNEDQLLIQDTIFENNNANAIVKNSKRLSILSGEFKNNSSQFSTIYNVGQHCSLSKTVFEGNSLDILNEKYLTLKDIKIQNDDSIINNGEITLKDLDEIEYAIRNNGAIKKQIPVEKHDFDFSSLDELIHLSKTNEIVLEHDFSLEEYELDYFEGGIDLDIDDLTIDGKNHVIDAKSQSRIFIVLAKGITLKNIIFKNGCSFKNYDNSINNDGAAIRNNYAGNLKIINCKFLDNFSEMDGGAIANNGNLSIDGSEFIENKSDYYGGSIYNLGVANISNTTFDKCMANNGGVIYNLNEIKVVHSTFSNNVAGNYGGAIYNHKDGAYLEVFNSCFKYNSIITKHVMISGGAINNDGELLVENNTFYANELYEGTGPAIGGHGKITDNDCVYENNRVLDKDDDY